MPKNWQKSRHTCATVDDLVVSNWTDFHYVDSNIKLNIQTYSIETIERRKRRKATTRALYRVSRLLFLPRSKTIVKIGIGLEIFSRGARRCTVTN